MSAKSSSEKFPIAEVLPAFTGSPAPFGGDGVGGNDRRKIAEHASRQVAGIVAQREKARVMRQCLTDSLQEAAYLYWETQDQIHRTEQRSRGKAYEQRITDFHGRLSQIHAAHLMGALKLEGETMALVLNASPFQQEPERRKGFLDRVLGK